MFTGIVEATAEVLSMQNGKLTLQRPAQFDDCKIGSSIAVSGVCLSIVELNAKDFSFDVIEETLRRSTLGKLQKGNKVNLERAMLSTARFEGHIVQGHTEGVANVVGIDDGGIRIALPHELTKYVVHKGSITIDGVSLTVAAVDGAEVSVALIPHTKEHTTLGSLTKGNTVNIETDILVKYLLTQHG